jgi:hypothetical protein
MTTATEGLVTPPAQAASAGWEGHARRWQALVEALRAHLDHSRPGEPRRNRALISDALLLLTRGDIPVDPAAPPTPAELIECVDLWRQDLGTHHRPRL